MTDEATTTIPTEEAPPPAPPPPEVEVVGFHALELRALDPEGYPDPVLVGRPRTMKAFMQFREDAKEAVFKHVPIAHAPQTISMDTLLLYGVHIKAKCLAGGKDWEVPRGAEHYWRYLTCSGDIATHERTFTAPCTDALEAAGLA